MVLSDLEVGRWGQRRVADVLLDARIPAVDLVVACRGGPRREHDLEHDGRHAPADVFSFRFFRYIAPTTHVRRALLLRQAAAGRNGRSGHLG